MVRVGRRNCDQFFPISRAFLLLLSLVFRVELFSLLVWYVAHGGHAFDAFE